MAENFSNKHIKEKSILELLNIIFKGRYKIIFSVIIFLILAFLYNLFSEPVFESTALLKKENTASRGGRDELDELIRVQTFDRLETEMELIKTNEVLGRVINDLKLFIDIKEIIEPNGNIYKLKNVLINVPDSGNLYLNEFSFNIPNSPVFKNFQLINETIEIDLFIKKIGEKKFELWNFKDNNLITSFGTSDATASDTVYSVNPLNEDKDWATAITDFAKFEFKWDNAAVGSKIIFSIKNYRKFVSDFMSSINVSRVGYSDVFKLSVQSFSPLSSKMIADRIIHHFREVRMEQQKQTIRYSFHFVDEQLNEIQKKLLESESILSNFKGSGKIVDIDQNTRLFLNYLSTLEAEKFQTELLLSNYRNKAEGMRKELESSGYIDQTFLEPSGESEAVSPFSSLISRLTDLEIERLKLLQQRTENHPDVVALDEQIRTVKEKLASYNQNTLNAYKIIINTLENKLNKIDNLLAGINTKIQQLPAQETQLARLIREKDVYEKIFKLLLDKREEMRVAELSQLQDVTIVDFPFMPVKPIKPKKLLNFLISLILGGFIGVVAVFVNQLMKTKYINIEYLEEELGLPLLALIPNFNKSFLKKRQRSGDDILFDKFVTLHTDKFGIQESYRLLNTKLSHLNLNENILMVTSSEEFTGKTTLVANLAITMALNEKNVLIIDCDLRKGDLSRHFNIFDKTAGLIDFLEKGDPPQVYNKLLKRINIIPSGGLRENSSILLNSDRMRLFFEKINFAAYDYVLIDTPPVTRVVDTLILGQYVKNAILVIRPDVSIRDAVIGGIKEMSHAQINIIGVVANATEIQNSYRYRYHYGYGYGYGTENFLKNKSNGHKAKKVSSIFRKKSGVTSA